MQVISLISLIALGMSLVSFVKFLRAKDWNTVVTMAATWVAGILVVFLAAAADIFNGVVLWDGVPPFGQMNEASKVLLGAMFLSLGSEVYKFRKAIDNHQTSEEPALLPPAHVVTPDGESVDPTKPAPRPRRVTK